MSLRKRALSSVYWTGLEQFGNQGIKFGVSIILARLLLPEEFGLIGMIYVFINIGQSLLDSGLTQSLIRSEDLNSVDYSTVFYFNFVGGFVIYAIMWMVGPYIAAFYDTPILGSLTKVYGLVFIIDGVSAVQGTRLTKNLDFKTKFRIQLPSLIAGSLVGVGMAYAGYGVWSLIGSSLVMSTLRSAQLWFYAKWYPTWEFSYEKFKYHFNYGYKLTLSGLVNTLYDNIYIILIGKYYSVSQLGYYTRAESLKQLPVKNIGSVLNKVTFPLFAKIKNDDERLRRSYKIIMQCVVTAITPTLLISAALATPLFRFLLTEKWLPAVPYYQILCWVGVLYPLNSYNLNVLKVKGLSHVFLKLEIYKKIIGITIVIISIQFGIFGLLYGSVAVHLISYYINSSHAGAVIEYPTIAQVKDIAPIILISICGALATYFFDVYYFAELLSDIFRLIVGTGIGVAIVSGLMFIFKRDVLIELLTLLRRK